MKVASQMINAGQPSPRERFSSRRSVAVLPRYAFRGFIPVIFLVMLLRAGGQTNTTAAANRVGQGNPSGPVPATTDASQAARAEAIRAACLENRRCVCGRVLKVFPTGVLVESGYPGLMRDALHGAWHLPGTVVANRATNLVEKLEPDSLCVGVVFLTDLPGLRGAKLEPYDFVVLHSYPAGQCTYTSVGGIQHTVRRFSGGLETAVRLILQSGQAKPIAINK